jgi:hypothetical protein
MIGFHDYVRHFPRTRLTRLASIRDASAGFHASWNLEAAEREESLSRRCRDISIFFCRGFLGNCMPGNLIGPMKALRRLGLDVRLLPTHTQDTVSGNRDRLAAYFRRKPPRADFVLCAHSRGGVEALSFLGHHPSWRSRCRGVLMAQTSRGPSLVLQSILGGGIPGRPYPLYRRWAERLQGWGIASLGARPAARELAEARWGAAPDHGALALASVGVPVWQMASWSIEPTSWLDAFHERLREIRPEEAHDGQFLLDDLLWPELPHVLLPRIDHAQPAMGGHGFDAARFWCAYLCTALAPDPALARG